MFNTLGRMLINLVKVEDPRDKRYYEITEISNHAPDHIIKRLSRIQENHGWLSYEEMRPLLEEKWIRVSAFEMRLLGNTVERVYLGEIER
jgi:hypothetical protein